MMLLVLSVVFLVQIAQCYRILGIFYVPGYSHYVLGETVFNALAAKGHEVTVISSMPQKQEQKNMKHITITELNDFLDNLRNDGSLLKYIDKSAPTIIKETYDFGITLTDLSLQNKNVQNLLNSNETFDLIILEQFLNEAHLGFMHQFKAPMVLMGTTNPSFWTNVFTANPTPFAYIPNLFVNFSPKMNFWERAYNTFVSTFQYIYYYAVVIPKQEEILHKYFPDAPPIEKLMHNVSLIMLNSHPTVGAAVPLQPNMIEIGGFHVQKNQSLPKNLKAFLDGAVEGVVYFSMGSNLQSKHFPHDKLKGILNAFSKLKMQVLWKWEDDNIPGKPVNVKTEKWIPQSAVLAHKNVKVFITHGGRLSTIEAIYFGKPILGIPMFAEQCVNIQEAVYYGYGLYIDYHDLDEAHLSKVLKEVIENPRYAETARYRSNALNDLQIAPLDSAVNWMEYVVKHKGIHHLKNAGTSLMWYQYLLLDVALFYIVIVLLSTTLFYIIAITLYTIFKTRIEKLKVN